MARIKEVADCGMIMANESAAMTTLERVKEEKTRITKEFSARIRQLNRAITILETTDPEGALKEVNDILYSGRGE